MKSTQSPSKPSATAKPPLGLLLVGLSGYNSLTLLTSLIAHRDHLTWLGPKGELRRAGDDMIGCITQTKSRGSGFSGLSNLYSFRSHTSLRVGGWDIYSHPLGPLLSSHKILDHDLVRQVTPSLNEFIPMPGVYTPGYISESLPVNNVINFNADATVRDKVEKIRRDIEVFKENEGVERVVVVWSGSVERESTVGSTLTTLSSLNVPDSTLLTPPSLIYALACSLSSVPFINTASQNTLDCPILEGVMLGTDFKCGQTKFKTVVGEYGRMNGWRPKVIASCNHLGNNDILNLSTLRSSMSAKLKKKHAIFAPWNEPQLDHKVSVLFTPEINDDKRDYVEYTHEVFLSQEHTMVTYTRCSDSVLCAPLILDSVILVDFFLNGETKAVDISKALGYLFKVPEGDCKGEDPGFGWQMNRLRQELDNAKERMEAKMKPMTEVPTPSKKKVPQNFKSLRISEPSSFPLPNYHVPSTPTILTAGLVCLDTQLLHTSPPPSNPETISTFHSLKSVPGGSASMTTRNLSKLTHGLSPPSETNQLIPPPVFSLILPICLTGDDSTGSQLLDLLDYAASCRNVDTSIARDNTVKGGVTSTAILPIYEDGRRGCFFAKGVNEEFNYQTIKKMLSAASSSSSNPIGAFVFGYPHLLPQLQSSNLSKTFHHAKSIMSLNGITLLDLNGVASPSLKSLTSTSIDPILDPAFHLIDILHLNEDEINLLLPGPVYEGSYKVKASAILKVGVAIVCVTRGKEGSYVACNNEKRFAKSPGLPPSWSGLAHAQSLTTPVPPERCNSNGAGDAFLSGFLTATMLRSRVRKTSPEPQSQNSQTPFSLFAKSRQASTPTEVLECNKLWASLDEITRKSYSSEALRLERDSDNNLVRALHSEGEISLEAACKFASEIAARHVDGDTREANFLNIDELLV
ncbi:hypothetical protein TrLO_g4513 [Triparma laevis f. longispina]|uniref:inositol-3-phosphate synthase n=1 Tax=Triparma laevis f. longispina TaxID=1714387 RepID=A0A9W6ZDA9_9STRA|nr:hypothetical protein TrLO_g4513 [Triparma laevis f. longispina]